ncbi:MAG: hypothetical protein L0Y55_13370, partial [Anaerolineales bacterium]|nr:hypothetical protein [Anaerolineales bacterium]
GTRQINEEMAEYCVPKIQENIQELGGIAVEAPLPTSEHLDVPQDWQQLLLFDSTQAIVQPRSKRHSKKARRKGLV